MPGRHIVVIGASAGGIDALQVIVSTLPRDFRAAIFVVPHTTEDGPSLLPQILNRKSERPVLDAVHNAPILPSRVYVAPAGHRHLLIEDGKLRLQVGPRENRNRPSIDALFRSASEAYGSQVIGVVLTGHLDDGGPGLADIKSRGGLAVVQDPEEALAPSMPTSAIESTEVDFVLGQNWSSWPHLKPQNRSNQFLAEAEISPRAGQAYSCPECGGVWKKFRKAGWCASVVGWDICIPRGVCSPSRPNLSKGRCGRRSATWKSRRSLPTGWRKKHARLVRRFEEG